MKVTRLTRLNDDSFRKHIPEGGNVRTVLLLIVAFALGLALSALWLHLPAKAPAPGQPVVQLSPGTKSVLAHLDKPVEVRLYSLLDPSSPAALREFSGRVEQLLGAYPPESNGKLTVVVFDSPTNGSPNAALAEGIKGFNLDKGEGCYLGVVISSEGKSEVMAQLAPEWESALEADLSRALSRVAQSGNRGTVARVSTALPEVVEQVKQQIPNFSDASLEEGTRLLREAALKEFSATVTEMQAQVHEAETRLQQVKGKSSAAEQEAAMKQLQDAQNAQSKKLKEIAAKSQAQIEAWKQLKTGGQ